MKFPTCRTCVSFLTKSSCCGKGWGGIGVPFEISGTDIDNHSLDIKSPDHFFCSEHETKDGERFVNWGE